jgi:hypothetical protein
MSLMGHEETNSAKSFLVRSTFNSGRLSAPQRTAVECQCGHAPFRRSRG